MVDTRTPPNEMLTPTASQTAAYTAIDNDLVMVDLDLAAGDVVITAPASPADNNRFGVAIWSHDKTHNRKITFNRNDSLFHSSDDMAPFDMLSEWDVQVFNYKDLSSGKPGWVRTGFEEEEGSLPGITASTTQTQAGGTSLVDRHNIVSNVANANDAVTIGFGASSGRSITIVNEGVNPLQLFPAADDDINEIGIDAAIVMQPGTTEVLWAQSAIVWRSIGGVCQIATPVADGLLTSTNVGPGGMTAQENAKFDGTDLTLSKASIGETADENTLSLVNPTAAAAGAQQNSPALRQLGHGWKTDAVASSQKVEFRTYTLPIEGTANPTGKRIWESSINDADYVEQMHLTTASLLRLKHANTDKVTVQSDLTYGNSKGLRFGDGDTAWYEQVDDELRARVGGVDHLTLKLLQFGVGLTSMQAKLHVADSLAISPVSEDVNSSVGRFSWLVVREVTILSGATTDTAISAPLGAMLIGVIMNVDEAVVDDGGDDTWSAAFTGGSTTSLATAVPASLNSKRNKLIVPEIASAVTKIRFTPNGGNFTAGKIEIALYYIDTTSLADV